jgi:hypothetical protein
MPHHILDGWWQQYREAKKASKLHHELLILLHGKSETAKRLIDLEKIRHPGQLESWYLDKVIYDLRRKA